MCFVFTILHRRAMGEKMKKSRHRKKRSSGHVGEIVIRGRRMRRGDEKKKEEGGVSAEAGCEGVGSHHCESRREEEFQLRRSGLVDVIE